MDIDWKAISVFVSLFIAWSTLLFFAIKFLLERALKAIDDKMAGLSGGLASTNERIGALEREFRDLLAQLPNIYVQREDWIRFVVTFDAKLDRLNDKMDKIREARS